MNGSERQHQHADGQGKGQKDLNGAGRVHAPEVHPAEEQQYHGNKAQFSGIDIPPGNAVEIAHIENAGQEIAREENHGHGIGRDDADITEHQRPAADKSPFGAETGIGISKSAAGHGIGLDQNAVAQSHNALEQRAHKEGDDCSQGAGIGQKTYPRQHKAAPAHNGAQGQGQHLDRAKRFFKLLTQLARRAVLV